MKKLLSFMIMLLSLSFSYAQTEVGDVTLPNQVTFFEQQLDLNGAGIREKFWIDLYAGGLYLETKSNNAGAIIQANKPMAIKLHIVSKLVSQEKMVGAVTDGFEKSTTGHATAAQRAAFIKCFKDEITEGNIFDIVYNNEEVTVYKNGTKKGSVKGLEFKKALFGIWLSSKPADKDLKKKMLGL